MLSNMNSTSPTSRPSHLTRSTTDKKIAGVSGGLAGYFGVDAVLIRIGFVVTTLFSGAGLLAYLALLALVPSDGAAPSGAAAAAA